MKTIRWILAAGFLLSWLAGCDTTADDILPPTSPEEEQPSEEIPEAKNLPEGCFEVNFSAGFGNGNTRAAVTLSLIHI